MYRKAPVGALVLVLAGCGGGGSSSPSTATTPAAGSSLIALDGSSTVYPISEAVAEEFQKANANIKVTVGISGSGGGFQKFCRAETDISDASRPITATEMELCAKTGVEYLELPIAYDGIAVTANPKANWIDKVTVAELKTMWSPDAQKKILQWKQVNPAWPAKDLHLFGAGVDSGTYDYFTEAVTGKAHSSRGDFTSSEDDNVLVQGIANDEGALGFVPFAYYEENRDKLKLLAVDDGKAENGAGAILPSAKTIADGTYQPLSRPVFIYVSTKAVVRPEVQKFVEYYLSHGPALAKEVGYVPLSDAIYKLVSDRYTRREKGSLFAGGGSVGLTIDQLLAKEQKK